MAHATTNVSERIEVYHETQPDSPIRESCSQNCEPANAMNIIVLSVFLFLVFRIISHVVKFRKLYIRLLFVQVILYIMYCTGYIIVEMAKVLYFTISKDKKYRANIEFKNSFFLKYDHPSIIILIL